ncbi:hypothetical protein LAZ67_1007049 [Cordylochernes scorpioides]|uniref:DUF5641 domain-containing protein n=1 Tax=Cordylochernes scorpioides TaxID=51811 RepID=A0ABY6K0U0_9ARAC|nr:hypothetical protein LAZ67_1007049 [Cordylochernes scorpioides]
MLGPDVATGSLVLIREEHVPPAKWMMGRVVKVHRGKDGLVRVVSIRTRTGILKRPLVKLALLPVPPNRHKLTVAVNSDLWSVAKPQHHLYQTEKHSLGNNDFGLMALVSPGRILSHEIYTGPNGIFTIRRRGV